MPFTRDVVIRQQPTRLKRTIKVEYTEEGKFIIHMPSGNTKRAYVSEVDMIKLVDFVQTSIKKRYSHGHTTREVARKGKGDI